MILDIHEALSQLPSGSNSLDDLCLNLPCFLHIHRLKNFSFLDLNEKMLQELGSNRNEVIGGGEAYFRQLIHKDDWNEVIDKNLNYVEQQDVQSHVSYFQRMYLFSKKRYERLYTRGKVIDDKRILYLSIPISDVQVYGEKVNVIFDRSSGMKTGSALFDQLSIKERVVAKAFMSGLSSEAISKQLNLSEHTIKNHRGNIYKKLGVKNYFDMYLFLKDFKDSM